MNKQNERKNRKILKKKANDVSEKKTKMKKNVVRRWKRKKKNENKGITEKKERKEI